MNSKYIPIILFIVWWFNVPKKFLSTKLIALMCFLGLILYLEYKLEK